MKLDEILVRARYLIFSVYNTQLGRVLERMLIVAEHIKHTPESPHVDMGVNFVIIVQIEHFGRSVHGRGLFSELFFEQITLVDRPRVVRMIDSGGSAAKIAQLYLVVARYEEVL